MTDKSKEGETWQDTSSKRVIMDNGAYEIKCSLASDEKSRDIYNAVGRSKKTSKVYLTNKLRDELEKGAQNIQVTHP